MSISDRLDQIEQHVNDPSPATGEESDYMVLAYHAPAMVAALRAVLDRHPMGKASVIEYTASGEVEHCLGCRGAHGIAHDEYGLVPWPCPTVRAIEAALGEDQ